MARKKISPWIIVLLIILVGVILNGMGILNLSELFSASPDIGPSPTFIGGSGGGGLT